MSEAGSCERPRSRNHRNKPSNLWKTCAETLTVSVCRLLAVRKQREIVFDFLKWVVFPSQMSITPLPCRLTRFHPSTWSQSSHGADCSPVLQITLEDCKRYKMTAVCGASLYHITPTCRRRRPPFGLLHFWLYYYCNCAEKALDGATMQDTEHDRGCPPPVDAVHVAKVYRVNICIMQYIRVAVLF